MSVVVVEAAAELEEFYLGCVEQVYAVEQNVFSSVERECNRQQFIQLQKEGRALVCLSEQGAPCGVVLWEFSQRKCPYAAREWSEGPVGWITMLFVGPEHRGKGYARALYEEAEKRAAKAGASVMWLDVYAKNANSAEFHKRVGYQVKHIITYMDLSDGKGKEKEEEDQQLELLPRVQEFDCKHCMQDCAEHVHMLGNNNGHITYRTNMLECPYGISYGEYFWPHLWVEHVQPSHEGSSAMITSLARRLGMSHVLIRQDPNDPLLGTLRLLIFAKQISL